MLKTDHHSSGVACDGADRLAALAFIFKVHIPISHSEMGTHPPRGADQIDHEIEEVCPVQNEFFATTTRIIGGLAVHTKNLAVFA
jgi:hypothetical protein